MKCLFILVILVGMTHSLQSQFVLKKSLDLILADGDRQYGVVPLGKEGVAIFNEVNDLESYPKRKWEIIHLNADLESEWRTYFESDMNFRITQVKYSNGFVYLLFQDSNIPMKSALFARSRISDNKIDFFEIKEFLPNEIVGFEILENSIFLIGIDNKRPAIMRFHYGDPRPLVLRGFYNHANELLSARVFHELGLIQIITRMKNPLNKRTVLLVKHFDESGEISKEIRIESSKKYELIEALATTDSTGSACVVGTFSYGKSRLSNGIFTMVHDNRGEHPIFYYDYSNLHNFFNGLEPKERERAMRKYGSDTDKRSSYRTNHVPREIINTNDHWQYLGEVIKFTERNSRLYGNMWPLEYREYSHAVVLGIGRDGKLRWDNTLAMHGLASSSSLQQAQMYWFDNQSMVYHFNGMGFTYKVMTDGQHVMEERNVELPTAAIEFSNEEMDKFGNILPWYDNKFLTFGSYVITPKNSESRKFFFLDAIAIVMETQ